MSDIKASSPTVAMRQKFWDELTADEKIERLRETIKSYSDIHNKIAELERAMEKHSHNEGKVVVEIDTNGKYATGPRSQCFNCQKCREEVII